MDTRARPGRAPRTMLDECHRALRPPASGPKVMPRADPRAFLTRLRHRTAAVAVVAFGAFFGLAAVNVVGVTAHATTFGGQTAASPRPTAVPTLAPGDFFGRPGAPVSGAGQAVFPPFVQPPLLVGGGAPMLSSGSS